MKSKKNSAIRIAVAASIALACGASVASDECSLVTLKGSYVFHAHGWGYLQGIWAPKAIVEVLELNGEGALTVPAATVANRTGDGSVVASPPGGTGTYTLNTNCTGTLNFTNGPSFNTIAAPKGDEFWMIQTNANNVLQGTVTRISK